MSHSSRSKNSIHVKLGGKGPTEILEMFIHPTVQEVVSMRYTIRDNTKVYLNGQTVSWDSIVRDGETINVVGAVSAL